MFLKGACGPCFFFLPKDSGSATAHSHVPCGAAGPLVARHRPLCPNCRCPAPLGAAHPKRPPAAGLLYGPALVAQWRIGHVFANNLRPQQGPGPFGGRGSASFYWPLFFKLGLYRSDFIGQNEIFRTLWTKRKNCNREGPPSRLQAGSRTLAIKHMQWISQRSLRPADLAASS